MPEVIQLDAVYEYQNPHYTDGQPIFLSLSNR